MRKGISSIISVVLMLLLVVAVFGGIYIWITKFQKKSESKIEKTGGEAVKKAQGLLKYQMSVVSIANDGKGNVVVSLRNDGSSPIRLSSVKTMTIKYDGKDVTPDFSSLTDIGGDSLWNKGEIFRFTLPSSSITWADVDDGETHTFEFEIGELGTFITETCGPLDPDQNACE